MSYDTIGKKSNSKNDRGSFNLHQQNPYQTPLLQADSNNYQ